MVDKVQMIGTAFLPVDRENKKILVSKRSMNKKYLPISVILLWSTIYNVFYLSQCKTELDDYYSFGQILFRLALPLIIGIIANKILTKSF